MAGVVDCFGKWTTNVYEHFFKRWNIVSPLYIGMFFGHKLLGCKALIIYSKPVISAFYCCYSCIYTQKSSTWIIMKLFQYLLYHLSWNLCYWISIWHLSQYLYLIIHQNVTRIPPSPSNCSYYFNLRHLFCFLSLLTILVTLLPKSCIQYSLLTLVFQIFELKSSFTWSIISKQYLL